MPSKMNIWNYNLLVATLVYQNQIILLFTRSFHAMQSIFKDLD